MKDSKHVMMVVNDDRDMLEQFKVILNDGYEMVEQGDAGLKFV